MKRVVITGMGVVTPIGNDVATFWDSIQAGRHGFRPITKFDVSDCEVKIAAEVHGFDPLLAFPKKEIRRTDLYTQYAAEAARQAVLDSNINIESLDPFRAGVIVGSGIGGLISTEKEHQSYLEKGGSRVSPFHIPMMIGNIGAGVIAMQHGFRGANFAVATACATSAHALGEAFRAIKYGHLDLCVAGGAEAALTKFAVSGFNNMKALSHSNNPDRASIPFDEERDGFIMGEGAGIVMLEEREHALARGAHIYAELAGYGATADAYHITSPHPDGIGSAKAMQLAYQEAGLSPDQIDYVNAHGTSTPLSERYETIAIKRALGDHAKQVWVSSTKSMTGHLLGAAGAVEAITCAKGLEEGFLPGNVGLLHQDKECDLNIVPAPGKAMPIQAVLSNSLGFGGQNAVLCLKKHSF